MNRILYADYLRVIGILLVIATHLSSCYPGGHEVFTNLWNQGVWAISITRAGVLLFILVSGMLLLNREEPISKVPQRLKRVLIPFFFWLFYFFLKDVIIDHTLNVYSMDSFITQLINVILDPTIISIEFWYIYMIIGFYLALPLLYKWIKNSSEKEIEYALVIWFVVLMLNFLRFKPYIFNYLNMFVGPLGYFILGYYLSKTDKKILNDRRFGLTLIIVGILITYLTIYVPSYITHQSDLSYILVGNIEPGSCFKAMGLFIILKNTNFKTLYGKKSDFINSKITQFAGLTYGIYLINNIPLDLIKDYGYFNLNISPFINIPLIVLVAVIVSSVILIILNKIPVLKNITGMKN